MAKRSREDEEEAPEQLQLVTIKQVADAGRELASLITELESETEKHLVRGRRHRAHMKELHEQAKTLATQIGSSSKLREVSAEKEEKVG